MYEKFEEGLRNVQGSPEDKERLRVFVRTLNGDLSREEGCARLGIEPEEFETFRDDIFKHAYRAVREFEDTHPDPDGGKRITSPR